MEQGQIAVCCIVVFKISGCDGREIQRISIVCSIRQHFLRQFKANRKLTRLQVLLRALQPVCTMWCIWGHAGAFDRNCGGMKTADEAICLTRRISHYTVSLVVKAYPCTNCQRTVGGDPLDIIDEVTGDFRTRIEQVFTIQFKAPIIGFDPGAQSHCGVAVELELVDLDNVRKFDPE